MLTETWREVVTACRPAITRLQESEHRLQLAGGGVIEGWSLDNADAVRGRAYKRVFIDEAAMDEKLEYNWTHVIRPTLTDLLGDAWFASTPRGLNYFWELWRRGQDKARWPDWRSWQRPSSENPHIPAEDLEAARKELPESTYRQEYLAEFLEGEEGIFRGVMESAKAEPEEGPLPGCTYVIGCDWAKQTDFTVFAVVNASRRRLVWVDRMSRIDYRTQIMRLQALKDRYRVDTIVAEENANEATIEQLFALGLPVRPFRTTNESKKAIIDRLSIAFERKELQIIPDQTVISELQAYRAERLPSGQLRYSAPSGKHDDCVMALALAWSQAVTYPEAVEERLPIKQLMNLREKGEPDWEDTRQQQGY